jgi:transposase
MAKWCSQAAIPMLQIEISDADLQTAKYERFENKSIRVRKRTQALFLKGNGFSHTQISIAAGVHINTVTNVLRAYIDGGISHLLTDEGSVPVSEMFRYETELTEEFSNNPPSSAKQAKKQIKILTGLTRSVGRVRVFMKQLGLSCRKVGHFPAKADPEQQEMFLKKTLNPLIKKAKSGKCQLLFSDAAHFVWGPYLGFLWTFARVFIPAPAGRLRLNVLGALNPISQELLYIANQTTVNGETICELLKKIKAKYKDTPVYLILDNAPCNRSRIVKELAKKLNIHLVFLPPYSPNLNLIERLWKWTKKTALNSIYYESFDDFKNGILDALKSINGSSKVKTELSSLLTLKFQRFNFSQNEAE